MNRSIRIDLHCHSSHSDGQLTASQTAARLAAEGVHIAALTDHDTLEGSRAFRQAARRHGMGCIDGVEITALHRGRLLHLLAYGIDPEHAGLLAALKAIRDARTGEIHSIAHNFRRLSLTDPPLEAASPVRGGEIQSEDAIRLVHDAGGKVFLAHPLVYETDLEALRGLLESLKAEGLDGFEGICVYESIEQPDLSALAQETGLILSGGSDFHGPADKPGIAMPLDLWRTFRDAVLSGQKRAMGIPQTASAPHRREWREFAFHIVLPTLLAMGLFIGAIFALALPALENALLERKREMIRELANSAWSILAEADKEVQSGRIPIEQAQELARQRISAMRYGREGKDYFWLQDMHPRMLMHPYRPDLNGQDVSDFKDPRGVRIFSEFANLVRREKQGYIEYVWQWKDDPSRLVPKESYVRGFEPWGWIIGTGIYLEDVHEEIHRVKGNLFRACLLISVAVVLLLAWVMRESLRIEKDRQDFEDHLRESNQRYRALADLANEGSLLAMNGRCCYANPFMMKMLGCGPEELELLHLDDALPPEANPDLWESIQRLAEGKLQEAEHEGVLRCRDGSSQPCAFRIHRIDSAVPDGLVLMARSLADEDAMPSGQSLLVGSAVEPMVYGLGGLAEKIRAASDAEQAIQLCQGTVAMARGALMDGAHPHRISGMLTGVCDAAASRFADFAEEKLGPPPCPYTLLALGSQGRREQTLITDQDNAILFEGPSDEAKASYFKQLGEAVCGHLHEAGYALCKGRIMADNPRWRMDLEGWQACFESWICQAEPQELLEFSIFFDLRAIHGEAALLQDLRAHMDCLIRETPAFIPQFAHHALQYKPPIGFFGRIVASAHEGSHSGMLDLKEAMMPLSSFARLYALAYEVHAHSAMDRLAALRDKGILLPSSCSEMMTVFDSLLGMRLRCQLAAIESGSGDGNLLDLESCGRIDRAILKESFLEIERLQKRIRMDFLGGAL